jgi:hypothetical protein
MRTILNGFQTILLIALVLGVLATVVVGSQKADRYLNNQALHDCAMDYRMQISASDSASVKFRPMEQQVKECAWNKGVRGWTGVWSDLTK